MSMKRSSFINMTSTKHGKRALLGYGAYGASTAVMLHDFSKMKKGKIPNMKRSGALAVTAVAASTYGQVEHTRHLNAIRKIRKGK